MASRHRIKTFIISLVCAVLSHADWALVGQSHSFECTTVRIQNFADFTWRYNDRTMFFCDSFEQACVPAFDSLLDNYTVIMTSNSSTHKSVLTIKTVLMSQHNTTWYCYVDSGFGLPTISLYNLNVFAPASSPICSNVTLRDDINIYVRCYTENVFPDALCDFIIKTNNTMTVMVKNGSVTYHNEPSSTAGYIRTECTYTVSAATLGPGSHSFYVVMYPNITADITEEIKRTSQNTNIFEIAFPGIALAPDCHVNDYIKEMQNSSCTCSENSPTFLPTSITWSDGLFQNGQLYYHAKRQTNESSNYICTISNKLNWTNQITYQPKVAYGPDNAIITINNFPNDVCDRNGVYISGTCTVSSSNPDPIVSIYVSNTPVTSQLKHNTTDYLFTQMVTESGISYVLCRAVNSVFREISTETITSITVKGPPKAPEIYSVSGNAITPREGNQLQVKEGNTDIVCESKGGYPLYKNITLECLTNRKSNENSDRVHMSLNIIRDMQGINCTCVVWHESKCLNNIVSVSLKLFEEEKNNGYAIIGGVIAAVVGILLLVVLTVCFVRRRSNILQRQYEEAHINKMQTYSHVQGSENYVNTENHHYETPNITTEHSAQADVDTQNTRMQPKLIATPYDNLNEGFNDEPRRSSEGNQTIKVNWNLDKETDFNPEEHHYDEISDVNA